MQWAVSQAVPFRRMHVFGDLVLHQKRGWASGGWMSDSVIDGNVDSGSQQQWISRNSEWGSWTGANWNMVFVGVKSPPAGEWPTPPYTKVAETPVVREKPFLEVDAHGNYSVRVPALEKNSAGITWHGGSTPGKSIPLSKFYIAHVGDTAAAINAELARGKNLLFTPGIYDLTEPIRVNRPDTIVMGLGFATLRLPPAPLPSPPRTQTASLSPDCSSTRGRPVACAASSRPGSEPCQPRQESNFSSRCLFPGRWRRSWTHHRQPRNQQQDTIVDHTWIWRADHGSGVGWDQNLSANGLVVNGNNVTIYGLFVEHHQQFQVLWNGNAGRTYFYQSEIPYDPPDQASYTSAPGVNGWASYKVADKVTTHEAWGLGIYSVFRHPNVDLTRAIEVPKSPECQIPPYDHRGFG